MVQEGDEGCKPRGSFEYRFGANLEGVNCCENSERGCCLSCNERLFWEHCIDGKLGTSFGKGREKKWKSMSINDGFFFPTKRDKCLRVRPLIRREAGSFHPAFTGCLGALSASAPRHSFKGWILNEGKLEISGTCGKTDGSRMTVRCVRVAFDILFVHWHCKRNMYNKATYSLRIEVVSYPTN